jgi:hypothetical protein
MAARLWRRIDQAREGFSGNAFPFFSVIIPAAKQARDAAGRFVPTIDTYELQAESELVNRALKSQTIDPEALREFSANREAQGWTQATEQFRQNHPDWIGGQANVELIGIVISDPSNAEVFNGLSPLESLERAYQHLVDTNQLRENPEVTQYQKLAGANSPEEIRRAFGRDSSGGSHS